MKAVNLKTKFAEFFSNCAFEDDTMFHEIPPDICTKSFLTDTGKRLVAVYNKTRKTCRLKIKEPVTGRLTVYDSECRVVNKITGGTIMELPCPADPFLVITLE